MAKEKGKEEQDAPKIDGAKHRRIGKFVVAEGKKEEEKKTKLDALEIDE